jgi:hypothetical protein
MIHYRINYYLSPFVSTELFFPLNHPTRSGIDQWRAAIGCTININDYFRLDPYYQIQQQMHRQTNYTFYLIGLNATIKFK